jgi:hypothetical protein
VQGRDPVLVAELAAQLERFGRHREGLVLAGPGQGRRGLELSSVSAMAAYSRVTATGLSSAGVAASG